MAMSAVSTANGARRAPPAGVIAPPHNLDAEQVGARRDPALGSLAVCAGDRRGGCGADDFYRERHGTIYEAMLSLYNESEPVDVLTVHGTGLRRTGKLEDVGGHGGRVDELTGVVPARRAPPRRYGPQIVARERPCLRRLPGRPPTGSRRACLGHEGGSSRAGGAGREVDARGRGANDRQQDFRAIEDVLHEELDKLHRLSLEGNLADGHALGLQGPG